MLIGRNMPKRKKIFDVLSKEEQKYKKKIEESYAQEIINYKECFESLDNLMWEIADAKAERKEDFNFSDVTIFAVCCRILGTSKVFIDLQIKGYKYDANIIMRSLLESALLLEWLIKDEKNAGKGLDGHTKFKTIRRELGNPSVYSSRAYDSFSDYVHSNFKSLIDLFKLNKKENAEEGMVKCITEFTIEPDVERGIAMDESSLFPSIGISALNSLKKKYAMLLKPEINSKIDDMFKKLNK